MQLKGKTALVTGGGIRVGRAIALALAAEGTNLVIHYNRSQDSAEETADRARSLGVQAITVGADFNDPQAIESLFPNALAEFEAIDILINSAAIYLRGNGMETDRKDWERQFRINLKAPLSADPGLCPTASERKPRTHPEHRRRPGQPAQAGPFCLPFDQERPR